MIYRWSKFYAIVRAYVTFVHNRFYDRIIITGKSNIPKDGPIIFAPNHQNALMDPLAIICSQKRQTVFLARADAFKNKYARKFLYKAKVLPIYRIRDGAESLKKNENIFNISVDILKNNKALALFPEGTHTDKRRLLSLKKAVTRIGFLAEDKYDFKLGVKVVPVGIYYSNYSKFRSTLQLNYGEPIELKDYKEHYRESERKGTVEFNDELAKRLKSLIISIDNVEFYDIIEAIRDIYDRLMVRKMKLGKFVQRNKFIADRKLVEIISDYADSNSEKLNQLKSKVNEYTEGIKKVKLKSWIFDKEKYSWFKLLSNYLLALLLLPFHIFGIINNYPAYKIPELIVQKNVKDIQFHSSYKLVIGLIMFPLYYIIVYFFMTIFIDSWWIRLAYVSVLPVSGVIAFEFMTFHRKIFAKLRYNLLVSKGNSKIISLKKLHDEIIKEVDEIVDRKLLMSDANIAAVTV